MPRLPLLVSIPHGGTRTPPELAPYVILKARDLFDDMDPHTQEIYEMEDLAAIVIKSDIARAFVDMNRAEDQLPPQYPDGVVKSMTCYQKKIYEFEEMKKGLIQQLLAAYYSPFHNNIRNALSRSDIELAIDCHSMAAIAPIIAPDSGKKRPAICLGNAFGKSCPDEIVKRLAGCLREAFHLEENEVSINEPFSGGFITRTYGNKPIPWIQIELNRALYLDTPWFDEENLEVDQNRVHELNRMFRVAMRDFFKR